MSHFRRRNANWVISNPIGLEIAAGNVSNISEFYGVGERDSIQTGGLGSDLWRGTAIAPLLPNQSGGEQMMILSSDYDDRLTGTGIQKVELDYLDAAGNEQYETVNMNGTAWVRTTGTNIRFVNALHALQVGSGTTASGDVSICANNILANVYNMISVNTNMSLSSQRMVPVNKTFYLQDWCATAAAANATTVIKLRLRATALHGTRVLNTFLFDDSAALNNSNYSKFFDIPLKIPQLSIIKVTSWVTAAGGYASASYRGFLKNNE